MQFLYYHYVHRKTPFQISLSEKGNLLALLQKVYLWYFSMLTHAEQLYDHRNCTVPPLDNGSWVLECMTDSELKNNIKLHSYSFNPAPVHSLLKNLGLQGCWVTANSIFLSSAATLGDQRLFCYLTTRHCDTLNRLFFKRRQHKKKKRKHNMPVCQWQTFLSYTIKTS